MQKGRVVQSSGESGTRVISEATSVEKDFSGYKSTGKFGDLPESVQTDERVNGEISSAFREKRCFEFYPDPALVESIARGDAKELYRDRILSLRDRILRQVADEDWNVLKRMEEDARLTSRIFNAIHFIHRAIARGDFQNILKRRFVIIKERRGVPLLYQGLQDSQVLTHVGSGPEWQEIPTIYLGLAIFDLLRTEERRGGDEYFQIFETILRQDERAIETGYYHVGSRTPAMEMGIQRFIEGIVQVVTPEPVEVAEAVAPEPRKKAKVPPFKPEDRARLIEGLDARVQNDPLNFDYIKNLQAMESLEELARLYKGSTDAASLREVIRLLVSASGHDIHEIRNRANIALERAFAPKEYDAPLATRFYNIKLGESKRIQFALQSPAAGTSYVLRVYRTNGEGPFLLQKDFSCEEVPLTAGEKGYFAELSFDTVGQFDFVVALKGVEGFSYLNEPDTSGRLNVMPDIRGEVILEIFTDIHGHTGAFWRRTPEQPGLVYNENGEVIRLGRFSDIEAHLEYLKERFLLSAIYLLGVQKRGSNRHDWAPNATSPSPFSPMSLTELEEALGGEKEFHSLVARAHALGIKIIVDVVPHLNRGTTELSDEYAVQCYDGGGGLVIRASTDGRYGSWNDGKLLNYRKFEVWEWLVDSVVTLIEKYDLDGIRFDSAHAVPIMMKRNNFPFIYDRKRSAEEMLEGRIIVNDSEDGHFITTGYFDCACRDVIAIPFHFYLMQRVEKALRKKGKNFFINLAECYWGHERYLARSGVIPYNSSLFKICENIIHGKSDVREIYHVYDNYFPASLPEGTAMLGILGNHDERRALNTFGHRGLRAATALTIFMSDIVMDYEGSAEGEGWKVYLDNIYVNWNQFEFAAHRSLENFYHEWYSFHRSVKGPGVMVWAGNNMVAAAMKFDGDNAWIGAFNFSESNQTASIQFDNPVLPIRNDHYFIVEDPLYSPITRHFSYYTGQELKTSRIHTTVSFTDRIKLLRLRRIMDPETHYSDFLKDSFFRLCNIGHHGAFPENFAFQEIVKTLKDYRSFAAFVKKHLVTHFWEEHRHFLELGLKRTMFHAYRNGLVAGEVLTGYMRDLEQDKDEILSSLGSSLIKHSERGSMVFMSAEVEPFSRSGGLGNVVFELPREMARLGEEVYVITGHYRGGDEKAVRKMEEALRKYDVRYSGKNVRFKILDADYEVGVYTCTVDGVVYYMLDHHEFFDGLYWGFTSSEKIRKRIAFARACAEVICTFGLKPHFALTNDAFAGLFNGIVKSDPLYLYNPNFRRTTFLHVIHNGGWQYFDAYHRFENGFDLFSMFNLPHWKGGDFVDPVHGDRINCMAAGVRFADRVLTVSPSYARQIEYACDGLERILHNVIGISNAIGEDFLEKVKARYEGSRFVDENWGRLTETIRGNSGLLARVEERYPEILKGADRVKGIEDEKRRMSVRRAMNKMLLQLQHGFEVDPDIIMFTMIHRITDQKGFQLLLDSSEGVFRNLKYQAIIGGSISSGDRRGEEIAHGLWLLSRFYSDQVSVNFGFQEISIPLLSSDLFVMPSMSEPGGISQLEALACGNLVLARATGGLRDTVFPLSVSGEQVEGNGILFSDYSAWAFYDAMERASEFFKKSPASIVDRARINAKKSVYYWDRPAKKYVEELYKIKEIIRLQ